jgi:hypothetical protein
MFQPVEKEPKEEKKRGRKEKAEIVDNSGELVNCLRNEIINVKLVEKEIEWLHDKRHPLYGGMVSGATAIYTVPRLRNGELKNPLTKAEKDFLEDYMGLEPNALSVHKRGDDNFWINRQVIVEKEGTVLDLSTPMGYINYKILLMNSDYICPSLEDLKLMPKATYKFVLVSNKDVYSAAVEKTTTRSKCWKEYLKVENKPELLKSLFESLTGTPINDDIKLEFLQEKVVEQLERNPKEFMMAVTDPLLEFRVIIKNAVNCGVVERRGDYYYYNNSPMCSKDENPTMTVAAKYISNARNQEILFSIQAKLK